MSSLNASSNLLLTVSLLAGLLLLFLAVRGWTPRTPHRRSLALFSGAGLLWTVSLSVAWGLLSL